MQMTNIIFLDIPVGTGFSYAKSTRSVHSTDIQYFDHAYEFMRKVHFSNILFYLANLIER